MKRIYVKDWRIHQTYRKDRGTPPWIKIQRKLLSSPKWARLTDAQKGQLVSIWMVAAEREGAVPADALILRKVCSLDDAPDVELLLELEFLTECQPDDRQVDDNSSSDGRQVSPSEAEAETESERETKKKSPSIPRHGKEFFDACATSHCLEEAFAWLDVLKRKKASMSELAWKRRLNKLIDYAKHEPAAEILARSACSGWSDLYERKIGGQKHEKRETAVQRRQRQAREALGAN